MDQDPTWKFLLAFGVDPDPDWIRGSMPLTNGSGSGSGSGCGSGSRSCYFFLIDIQDANKKLIFLNSLLLITS